MFWGLWAYLMFAADYCSAMGDGHVWLFALCLSPVQSSLAIPWDQLSSGAAIQGERVGEKDRFSS